MQKLRSAFFYFSAGERWLWICSVFLILASYLLFPQEGVMTLCASLIGVTALILNARGNPAGQLLMIVFSVLYGIISYSFSYYGEMITYLGMSGPMAVIALVEWLRHPSGGNHAEVEVGRLGRREPLVLALLTAAVTAAFFFILRVLGTTNLLPSTVSVATSFLAAYLTFRRSPYFALAYAANDLVLLVLWFLAAAEDLSYLSVLVCFAVFLVNDLYGFVSWRRMQARQAVPIA